MTGEETDTNSHDDQREKNSKDSDVPEKPEVVRDLPRYHHLCYSPNQGYWFLWNAVTRRGCGGSLLLLAPAFHSVFGNRSGIQMQEEEKQISN